MDRETVIKLHGEAAKYHALAHSKWLATQDDEDFVAEETWYDVCCWLYARIKEAE